MLIFEIRYMFLNVFEFVTILNFTFFHEDHEHVKLNFKTFLITY